ncbi:hypothetical protein GYMLUDRAFT_247399 [Collybiopsis luxurians FD-317 M1]|uniref:Wax synthase domain-containing protein n=1 Tax=Collybiopsis luxurians FD-317 M1 TaxID=944289 RepID=A0A0D0BP47_9AGAR|nr:hypothetical protein GYMLUDRAFT_247399 [Collybiopsis luxurians FD-317 M1]
MVQQLESDDDKLIVTLILHSGWLAFANLFIGVCIASRLPKWTLHLSFAFIVSGCLFAVCCRTGQATIDYTLGSVLGTSIFNAFHLLVLAEPAKQYRHRLDDSQEGPNNLSWVKRVYWGCCVSASVRGVGWNFQAPHLPKPQRMGRVKFFFHAINQLLFYFLVHDLAQTLSRTVPYLHLDHTHNSHDFSIRSLPYTKRVLCTVTWLVGACSGIQLCYYSIALVWVGTGWFSSEECPPLFGDWRETYSVRNFWGYPQRMGRVKFFFHAINQLLFYFLVHDLAQTLSRTVPYLHLDHTHNSHDFSIRSLPYTKRVLCTVTWLVGACSGIQLCYYSIALVWVGTGWFSSEECPPLFGDWRETYSVRNFWGKTWHQFVRRFALAPGKKLVQTLRIPPKSPTAAFLKLYTAFLVSGTVHFIGDLMVRKPEYYGVSILFFTLQAVGITIEELLKFFVRRYGHGWDRTLPDWVGKGVGKTWHQFVRRFALAPGKKLVQTLRIPPKSPTAAFLKLYTAFLVSGTVHFIGDLMVRKPEYYGVSILFFTLQAVGITIEELLKFFVRRYGHGWDRTLPDWVGKGVGYVWVLYWLTLTMPVLIDPATEVGFDKESLIPVSPVKILFSLYSPPAFTFS